MMTYEPAPFYEDVSEAPEGGQTFWARARDGVRLRMGAWRTDNAKGTVLLFPGRTEYIEKYGGAVSAFAGQGYASLVIDWRGQGLADRLIADHRIGHVGRFSDYQADVVAMIEAAEALDLPKPYFLLAHSMGGCIGLRALMDGLPVNAAAFTGPMWGIRISPVMRPIAWALSSSGNVIGLGHRLAPTTKPAPYVLASPYVDNMLTTDASMYALMQTQLQRYPDLALGGPSLTWLNEALKECLTLSKMPAPAVPTVTWLGALERIVDVPRVHTRMASWSQGHLEVLPGTEHEVQMEGPAVRQRIYEETCARFDDFLRPAAAKMTA